MPDITNPHDRFFKEVFSRPEVAEDFAMHFLPLRVSGLIEPGTFQLSKDSFVAPDLRAYFSDLLYKIDFKNGRNGFAYLLFEHKSYPASDTALQLLHYMTQIWRNASKQQGGSLPPVIPLVLYHGSVQWRMPLNFAALYEAPEALKEGLCDFTYHLCDLTVYPDEQIKMGAMASVALRLLKHVHSKDLAERLKDAFALFRAMNEQTALRFLETVLRYLGAATETVTMDDCRKAVKAALSERGDTRMGTLIDELIEDHMKRLRREWMKEGPERAEEKEREWLTARATKASTAFVTIRQLSRKFDGLDAYTEQRIRWLPIEALEKLAEDLLDFQEESELKDWLDRFEESQ